MKVKGWDRPGSKINELIDKFFIFAEFDQEGDLCVPLFAKDGKLFLYQDHPRSYQRFALYDINRLQRMGIFFVKKRRYIRKRAFLCVSPRLLE